MTEIPGTAPSAFIAFAAIEELIDTLTRLGVLPETERGAMLNRLAERFDTSTKAPAKEAAKIVRRMIYPVGGS